MKKIFLFITLIIPFFTQAQFNKVPSAVLPLSDSCYINITDTINPYNGGNTLRKLTIRRAKELFGGLSSVTPAALTKNDDTNVTLTLVGTPSLALLQPVTLTLGWTGTLADSRITSADAWNAKQDAITIGNTSQYLRGDLSLATFPSLLNSPLTTKGDLWTYDSDNSRLPIGMDGQVLTANSSSSNGVDWETFNGPIRVITSTNYTIPTQNDYTIISTFTGTGGILEPPSVPAIGQTITFYSTGSGDFTLSPLWGLSTGFPLLPGTTSSSSGTVIQLSYQNTAWVVNYSDASYNLLAQTNSTVDITKNIVSLGGINTSLSGYINVTNPAIGVTLLLTFTDQNNSLQTTTLMPVDATGTPAYLGLATSGYYTFTTSFIPAPNTIFDLSAISSGAEIYDVNVHYHSSTR